MLYNFKSFAAAVNAASTQIRPLGDLLRALAEGGVSRNFVAAVATAGAATVAGMKALAGVITSEALTTAAGAEYTLTVTADLVTAADMVVCTVENGTNTTASPSIQTVTAAAGSFVVKVRNNHASAALNGTIKVKFRVIKGA